MIVTTTPSVEGYQIAEYLGVVAGDAMLGAKAVSDVFAAVTDLLGGQAASYEQELAKARTTALEQMEAEAESRGATAIVGASLTYGVINTVLVVTASGTAVRLG